MTSANDDLVVVDASVVVDLLVGPDPGLALALPNSRWHAPAHLDVEVVHALRGLMLGRHISRPRAVDALRDYADLAITRWPLDHASRHRCLQLGDNLTAYDAGYVALAEGLSSPLITRDRGLATVADRYVTTLTL